ncbi:EKC/KEOPS complex subunit GON7 [Pelodytes ibericus]
MEVSAELTGRDGTRRPFHVGCERSLKGLLSGVEQLKGAVSAVLTELVLLEKGAEAPGTGKQGLGDDDEEEEEEEEEEEDDDDTENGTSPNEPPTKRTKTQPD